MTAVDTAEDGASIQLHVEHRPGMRECRLAARSASECCPSHPQKKGRREGRELAAPMARVQKKSTRQNHRFGQDIPALPARWCYGLYALSPGTGVIAPVIRAPVERCELGISTGMPGPRDFTVASETFVRMIRSRCDQIRPPHPAPDVRDDREAPLV
jgi:hypothetical protein